MGQFEEDERARKDYIAEIHNDLMARGMIVRPKDSMIGKEFLKRIHVRVSHSFPCSEGEVATAIMDLAYAGRLAKTSCRKIALYNDEDRAMKAYAEKVYKELRDSGKIDNTVDSIAGTECFTRVYARVKHVFPRTENEVARALMSERKAGKCESPESKQKESTKAKVKAKNGLLAKVVGH